MKKSSILCRGSSIIKVGKLVHVQAVVGVRLEKRRIGGAGEYYGDGDRRC